MMLASLVLFCVVAASVNAKPMSNITLENYGYGDIREFSANEHEVSDHESQSYGEESDEGLNVNAFGGGEQQSSSEQGAALTEKSEKSEKDAKESNQGDISAETEEANADNANENKARQAYQKAQKIVSTEKAERESKNKQHHKHSKRRQKQAHFAEQNKNHGQHKLPSKKKVANEVKHDDRKKMHGKENESATPLGEGEQKKENKEAESQEQSTEPEDRKNKMQDKALEQPGSDTASDVHEEKMQDKGNGQPEETRKKKMQGHHKVTKDQKMKNYKNKGGQPGADSLKNANAQNAVKASQNTQKTAGQTKGNPDAKKYISTANAAIDAAAEAVVDAEALEGGKSKVNNTVKTKGVAGLKYLKAASDAVTAAHQALSKAAELGGFGPLPAPNLQPMGKVEKGTGMAKTYAQAASEAVNAAEKALDNLAAVGYPEVVVPSIADGSNQATNEQGDAKKHELSQESDENEDDDGEDEDGRRKSHVEFSERKERQGEFIEEANRAVDDAHEALVNAELKLPENNME